MFCMSQNFPVWLKVTHYYPTLLLCATKKLDKNMMELVNQEEVNGHSCILQSEYLTFRCSVVCKVPYPGSDVCVSHLLSVQLLHKPV